MQFLNRLQDAVFHSLTPPPGARIEDLFDIPSKEAHQAMDRWLSAKIDAASSYDEIEGTFSHGDFARMNAASAELAGAWQKIQDAVDSAAAQFEGRKHAARALVQGELLAQAIGDVRSHIARQKQHALQYRRTIEHAFDRVAAKHDIPDVGYNHVFNSTTAAANIAALEQEIEQRIKDHQESEEANDACKELKEVAERISNQLENEFGLLELALDRLPDDVRSELREEFDLLERKVERAKEKLDEFANSAEEAAPEDVDAPSDIEEQLAEAKSIVEFSAGPGPRLFAMLVLTESMCGKLAGFLHALEMLEEELDRASLEFRTDTYGAPEPFAMIKDAWERWIAALDAAATVKGPPHPSREPELFKIGVWPDERLTMEQQTAAGCRLAHVIATSEPATVYGNPGAAFAFMRDRVCAIGQEAEMQTPGLGCDYERSLLDDVPPDVQAELDASVAHFAWQEEAEKAADAAGL